MRKYKYVYLNDEYTKEIEDLAKDGHGNAIAAFGLECANATLEGRKMGELYTVLGVVAGAAAGYLGGKIFKGAVKLYKRRKTEKTFTVTVK